VPATGGASVPLSAVADIQFGADRGDARPVLNLPAGVRQVPAGDEEFIQEMLTGFGIAFASGILLMYAVLTLLFKSFAYPITIMAALPLAIGGAFIALAIGGANFSMSALIGVLMLMGIAAKNSILLVDYVIMAEKDGMPRREAIMDAAHKRARPILMTTFAMGRAWCRSPWASGPTSSSARPWPSPCWGD
jgi:HAE1 family hydrophobic/amphiphilic exporter-1